MSDSNCCICSKSKAGLTCGLCRNAVCKKCAQFIEENSFSFLKKLPEELSHNTYCENCYTQTVATELAKYADLMEKAKNIAVFMKAQYKETRYVKRTVKAVNVSDCADYDETLLRLAFQAVQLNFNGIVDVEITSKKVKIGNYQTTAFAGTAVPANIREDKLVKDRSTWSNPN